MGDISYLYLFFNFTAMKKICFHLLLLMSGFIFQACPLLYSDDPDMHCNIVNKCNEKIYPVFNVPDTIISPKSFPFETIMVEHIDSGDTLKFPCHSKLFDNNRKLNILIYKASTLNEYSWQEIQEQNIFDKRYVLSLDDLKAINYTVVYDGK